ncbi:MAG: hypothetical protein ACJAUV_002260 [Flavobacteriales bacterium]|jgi:hypothetical protein
MTFEELAEYKRDLKHLSKKYRTLKEDLLQVKTILKKKPEARAPFGYRIDNLGLNTCVIKVKKIACRSLKGRGVNSGLILIYAHFTNENKIVFIELYHKNDKDSEDRQRILANFE